MEVGGGQMSVADEDNVETMRKETLGGENDQKPWKANEGDVETWGERGRDCGGDMDGRDEGGHCNG